MKATVRKEVKIVLEMTETEATWLMHIMQNKWHQEESQDDAEVRHKFFTSLNDILNQDIF